MNLFSIVTSVIAFHCMRTAFAQNWKKCDARCGSKRADIKVNSIDYSTGICYEKCVPKNKYRKAVKKGYSCGSCGPKYPLTEICDDVNNDQYDICMKLKVNPLDAGLFIDAAKQWTDIIKNDLPDVKTKKSELMQLPCGPYPETIDDLYLCGWTIAIDGPKSDIGTPNILGGGFTYYVRATEPFLAYVGGIVLDYEDMDQFRDNATYWGKLAFDVIRHEVGHVIGIGTTWYDKNVAEGNFTDPQCNYTGVKTNTLYKNWTGCDRIPLHHEDGEGSMCGHWDEFCLQEELFTALGNDTNLLSALSIASLEDIGYTVDYSTAENYTKDNINPACLCNTNRRMQEDVAVDHHRITEAYLDWKDKRNSRHRKLSEDGRNIAVSYGHQLLTENTKSNQNSARSFSTDSELIYVGDRGVTVFVMENDVIHDVWVTPDTK